jgi:hypothetical protein
MKTNLQVMFSGLQVPTLGIDSSFVSTRELLTSSAPRMLLSRLPLLLLNLVWRLKLPLQILERGLLLQFPSSNLFTLCFPVVWEHTYQASELDWCAVVLMQYVCFSSERLL